MATYSVPQITDDVEPWLTWLQQRVDINHIDLGLERISEVYLKLVETQELSRCGQQTILVAGTNGKGTTIAALEALFTASGKSVGCYTSPHLHSFRERVRIEGVNPTDSAWIRAFNQVESARGDVDLTWFEFTTLAAFILLSDVQLDVCLLEIGLGGRYDAVNVVDGVDASIVTGVALDHTEYLGTDIEGIAWEKAGVYRTDRVGVYADYKRCDSIDNTFVEIQPCASRAGIEFHYGYEQTHTDQEDEKASSASSASSWYWNSRHGEKESYQSLPIPHIPIRSWAAALACINSGEFDIGLPDHTGLCQLIERTRVPGRMHRAEYAGAELIIDVAHNQESVEYLAETLRLDQIKRDQAKRDQTKTGRIIAVMGVLSTKDITSIIEAMHGTVDLWLPVQSPSFDREISALAIQQHLQRADQSYIDVEGAMKSALAWLRESDNVNSDDTIVIFGSFYAVSEALSLIELD